MGIWFKRKEILVPTWRAFLAGLLLLCGFFVAMIQLAPPFLSPNRPLNAPVLVVEGWVSESALEHALRLQTNYQLVVVTGGPVEKGTYLTRYGTFANVGVSRMREMGFTGTNLVAVPSPKVMKDRTYHCALALKAYLSTNTTFREVDLLSDGFHSRRSWLLFRLACKPDIKVGVIADIDPEFDAAHWWRTSYGVRSMINEVVGYLYAKTVFVPD